MNISFILRKKPCLHYITWKYVVNHCKIVYTCEIIFFIYASFTDINGGKNIFVVYLWLCNVFQTLLILVFSHESANQPAHALQPEGWSATQGLQEATWGSGQGTVGTSAVGPGVAWGSGQGTVGTSEMGLAVASGYKHWSWICWLRIWLSGLPRDSVNWHIQKLLMISFSAYTSQREFYLQSKVLTDVSIQLSIMIETNLTRPSERVKTSLLNFRPVFPSASFVFDTLKLFAPTTNCIKSLPPSHSSWRTQRHFTVPPHPTTEAPLSKLHGSALSKVNLQSLVSGTWQSLKTHLYHSSLLPRTWQALTLSGLWLSAALLACLPGFGISSFQALPCCCYSAFFKHSNLTSFSWC